MWRRVWRVRGWLRNEIMSRLLSSGHPLRTDLQVEVPSSSIAAFYPLLHTHSTPEKLQIACAQAEKCPGYTALLLHPRETVQIRRTVVAHSVTSPRSPGCSQPPAMFRAAAAGPYDDVVGKSGFPLAHRNGEATAESTTGFSWCFTNT